MLEYEARGRELLVQKLGDSYGYVYLIEGMCVCAVAVPIVSDERLV